MGVHTYMKTQKIVLVAELRTTHNQLMTSREEIRVVISVIFFFFFLEAEVDSPNLMSE